MITDRNNAGDPHRTKKNRYTGWGPSRNEKRRVEPTRHSSPKYSPLTRRGRVFLHVLCAYLNSNEFFSRKPRPNDARFGAVTRPDLFGIPQVLRCPVRARRCTRTNGANHRTAPGRGGNFACSSGRAKLDFQTFHLNYVDLLSIARVFVDEPEHWPKLPAPTD